MGEDIFRFGEEWSAFLALLSLAWRRLDINDTILSLDDWTDGQRQQRMALGLVGLLLSGQSAPGRHPRLGPVHLLYTDTRCPVHSPEWGSAAAEMCQPSNASGAEQNRPDKIMPGRPRLCTWPKLDTLLHSHSGTGQRRA